MMPNTPVLQKPGGIRSPCPIELKEEESFCASIQVSEEMTCKGSPVAFPWFILAVIQGISKRRKDRPTVTAPKHYPSLARKV